MKIFFTLGLSAIVLVGCTVIPPAVQKSTGLPMHIQIPAIHLDTAIEHVSLTPDGVMDVPKIPTNTAWFDLGPRPGEKGTAVIDGHLGWKNGVQGAFDHLYQLRIGDTIHIEDENGIITTFVAREIRSYDSNADAPEVFHSNDGKAHLNLITCEGVWDTLHKSYSKRLVVFADEEIE